MNGKEFFEFIEKFEETTKFLNQKYGFMMMGRSKIKYVCETFDENDNEFLMNLGDYMDDLNDVMDTEFKVHFTYQYLNENGLLYLFPDFKGTEYVGGKFEN